VKGAGGEVTAPAEITDGLRRGVVSLPHGWGHDRRGARLGVAGRHAGVSFNDVTDDQFVDELTGTAVFSGIAVDVSATAVVVLPLAGLEPVAGS
jgi:anaerobic selenocysteine-containing dehydrogenase